jgi:uncharacterized protein YndB with AHSA1/START domain
MPESATQVDVTRVFDAPREAVFAAFTDPEQVMQWWGPEHFDVPRESVTIDLREGGRYDLTMVQKDGGQEYPVRQEILELDPPELLVLRHEPMPDFGMLEAIDTRVEFHHDGGATRVEITSGPYSAEMGPNAQTGWEQQLDKLAGLLSA